MRNRFYFLSFSEETKIVSKLTKCRASTFATWLSFFFILLSYAYYAFVCINILSLQKTCNNLNHMWARNCAYSSICIHDLDGGRGECTLISHIRQTCVEMPKKVRKNIQLFCPVHVIKVSILSSGFYEANGPITI